MINWSRSKKILVAVSVLALFIVIGAQVVMRSVPSKEWIERRNAEREQRRQELQSKRLRLKDIPEFVVSPCRDSRGQIADLGADFNFSDVIDNRPNSRLVVACHYPNGNWYIHCESGGYGLRHLQFMYEERSGKWEKTPLVGEPHADCGPDDRP